nr:glial fibrillary acidic protein-like [Procambarus clarkii]
MAATIEENLKLLRDEFNEWRKGVECAMSQEECVREEEKMVRLERDHLALQLSRAHNTLKVYNNRLRDLMQNYAAIAVVIEKKNQLMGEVAQLQQQLQLAQQIHSKELKELQEAALKQEAIKVTEAVQQEQIKAKDMVAAAVAAAAAAAQEEKEQQLKIARQELTDERQEHLRVLMEMRTKHHNEEEQLRGRLAQLQLNLSARATSNMDLFANKLQATRAEFEEQLVERDSRLAQLKEELRKARETLKHQQLLSVVRGVATAATATPTPTPISSPVHSFSLHTGSEPAGAAEGDLNSACSSEHETGESPSVRKSRAHNRTQPMPKSHAGLPALPSPPVKSSNKRKLYSGKSFLQEENDAEQQP